MNLIPILIPVNNIKKIDVFNLTWNNPIEIIIVCLVIFCFISIIVCVVLLIKNMFD
ncbi:MAG: hypothetical protein BWY38_02680 [Ignavibacteria bacterium ADurb.Bin266]|nr:MAG: hypothetical protein BWY38_02680 [Ignavibacteria bacterium ADurb.Bin266]